MLLLIGLDSFDTPFFGCTTHAASLIVLELLREGYQLADYPWLVRLNPSIPWRTRGNGAVTLLVSVDSDSEARAVASIALRIARAYDVLGDKASLVIVEAPSLEDEQLQCTRSLYMRAVRGVVGLDEAVSCLKRLKLVAGYGLERRGLIGSIAALGGLRPGDDTTFELLTYRCPNRWLKPRSLVETTVVVFDYVTGPYTFANYDYEQGRVLVAPHGHDPVLYGVRGEDPRVLLQALKTIESEQPSHYTIFRSNQATNAHLNAATECGLYAYEATWVEGRVMEVKRVSGGHTLIRVASKCGTVTVLVYRETGRLNSYVQALVKPGARIRAYGVVKQRRGELVLNAEAIEHLEPYEPLLSEYTVPGTQLVVASTASLHHLAKPFERYLNMMVLGIRVNAYRQQEPLNPAQEVGECAPFTPR